MLLIITIFTLVVLFYYWDAIKGMLQFFNTTQTPAFSLINPWFLSLLFINLIVLTFQVWFYYSKVNSNGQQGSPGIVGFPGYEGSPCTVACW